MCCRVMLCCCCFDLRRGVQVLGIFFLICNIIALVTNIISLNNTKTYYSNCMTANANTINNIPISQDLNMVTVTCDTGTIETVAAIKYWDKNYSAILGSVVGFEVFFIIIHVLLIWGATVGNRCMLLPWLIVSMIAIVLLVIGIIFVIIAMAIIGLFGLAGGIIAVVIIAPAVFLAFYLYFWIVVQSLYKQFGEENVDTNQVSPMAGGGRISHHNHWDTDDAYYKDSSA